MTKDEAIRDYTWLVNSLAGQFLKPGLEREDLVQEAYIGLLVAFDLWKPDAGKSFSTLARQRIIDALEAYVCASPHSDRHQLARSSPPASDDTVSLDEPVKGPDSESLTTKHEIIGEEPTQEAALLRREEDNAVRGALGRLDVVDRRVLETWANVHVDATERGDVAGGGGAVPEVARILGIPRTTADYRVRTAKDRLLAEVAPFVDREVA